MTYCMEVHFEIHELISLLLPKGGRCFVLLRPSETAVWQSASGLQRFSGYNERVQVSKVRCL